MSKPLLRHAPDASSSPSSSCPQSMQRCHSFQLLHGLPSSLLFEVCSFLSVYQVVSTLRRSCQALHGRVAADCLQRCHLVIASSSLPSLAASKASTRTLLSRIPSLTISHQWDTWDEGERILTLHKLRSPLEASRFLLSSLQSLHIILEKSGRLCCPPPLAERCLLIVLQLLADRAASFSSLRRLHIDARAVTVPAYIDLSFAPLARLPALTDCRIDVTKSSVLPWSSLLSTLSSTQFLTSLYLRDSEACPQLLRLLCAESNTPLLLRLRSLFLPSHYVRRGDWDELHDALLRRLSSLPAPSALQHFSGLSRIRHRAAGLLSVFSLPCLTQLDLGGWVRPSEFATLISSFTSAPAPLVSLVMPCVRDQPDDDRRENAAVAADGAAVDSAMRLLLSRFTSLRQLQCHTEMADGAVALPGSRPGDHNNGCSGSLYSLTVRHSPASHFPFTAPVSFPQLTELVVTMPMTDAELELLLSACPQLLRLDCAVSQGWRAAVLITAQCCRCLLELAVRAHAHLQQFAFAEPQPDVTSPFLPQLVNLKVVSGIRSWLFSDLAVLRHFTAPPHARLRKVVLECRDLTAEHVLSLACLPRLYRLMARRYDGRDGEIAELQEARRRTP